MSEHAIGALVVIALEQRRGQWFDAQSIQALVPAPGDRVIAACEELTSRGALHFATRAGVPVWGLQVEGVLP